MKILLKLINWRTTILRILIFIIVIISSVTLFLLKIIRDLPRVPEPIGRINHTPATEIFSSDGHLIFTLGGCQTVKLENVSNNFLHAIVATEDHRFWEHHGVSKIRILKAIFITFLVPEKIQGASTITQQLAKNLFFSFEKTYARKLRELLVALQIEAQFSKEEILEAYVNQIPFGAGAYGIEQASKIFFGKPASDLNLSEASLLAGIPKSPTRYNPYRHPKRAKKRQMVVLKRLLQTDFINKDQLCSIYESPLSYHTFSGSIRVDNYFLDAIIKYLERNYGTEVVYHSGLKVYTTMDSKIQKFAETSLENGLRKLENQIEPSHDKNMAIDPGIRLQGAVVSLEVGTGAVKAMVGGRDFHETPFNRAIKNNRQSGSGFKPFLYYSAFADGGMSPDDVIVDKKVSIPIAGVGVWKPRNFGRHYKGPLVIKKAFVDSVNTVAAQLVERIGPKAVIDTAHKCGIKSNLDPVFSVALGTSGVSPFEMASAFSTFASGGFYKEPYMVSRVQDINGRVLEEHVIASHNVLDPAICYQVIDMMCGVVNIGPGKAIRYMGLNMDIAGKTGTTNDYNDAWFTGFTPSLSTSVWIGFDKCYGMKYKGGSGVTGGTGAAPIWSDFMLKVIEIYPSECFKVPDNIAFSIIDPRTGKKAGFWSDDSIQVALVNKKSHQKSIKSFYKNR